MLKPQQSSSKCRINNIVIQIITIIFMKIFNTIKIQLHCVPVNIIYIVGIKIGTIFLYFSHHMVNVYQVSFEPQFFERVLRQQLSESVIILYQLQHFTIVIIIHIWTKQYGEPVVKIFMPHKETQIYSLKLIGQIFGGQLTKINHSIPSALLKPPRRCK